ncbi:zinc transporter ZIP1-like isoform X1 [Trematomus bernacchii]|uniref:zinc transporter ZIP1-like isoform X1 n=1 Tax=Trematomus bernacchii TaxID=40690 RepID=UPI00146F3DE0|nr:zinc transporter ZIP1-like isoform X1 [Trematomus bernacchii]XP_033978458.1 zinc transporter ZIP1-like isoform X1 [Trematomus bernacchii]
MSAVVGGVSSSALRAPGGALVLLLSVTLLSGFSPLCIARGGGCCSMDPRFRRRLLSLISCFAGGVFLATCLLEQLPDYLQSIEEAFSSAGVTLQFPLPEFIMAMGFFLVLVLEQVILAFKDQPQMKECRALLPNSSVNSHRHGASEESGGSLFHVDLSAQSALRSFVLVFSLSLHSVLEGLAVGLQEIYVASSDSGADGPQEHHLLQPGLHAVTGPAAAPPGGRLPAAVCRHVAAGPRPGLGALGDEGAPAAPAGSLHAAGSGGGKFPLHHLHGDPAARAGLRREPHPQGGLAAGRLRLGHRRALHQTVIIPGSSAG